MATFLELVNLLGENLRYNEITEAEFDAPRDPFPALKRFINEAKDSVVSRVGSGLFERDLFIETNAALTYENVGNLSLTTGGLLPLSAVAPSAIFDGGWLVGAKIQMLDVEYTQTADPAYTGGLDSTWRRITELVDTSIVSFDAEFSNSAATSSDWVVFRDDYNLDNRVRKVLSAWTNDGPLSLEFVDDLMDIDRMFPGEVNLGTPTVMAIARSNDEDYIWSARLYPAPLERTIVRYRAVIRLDDLEEADDTWPIEPELQTIILDEATRKACASPIRNDPDLAVLYNQDVARRAIEWRNENTPVDPYRRRRRRGPNEALFLHERRVRTIVSDQ